MITAKPVELLGGPVGNMWDLFKDGVWAGRYSYFGNVLVPIHQHHKSLPTLAKVTVKEAEAAINLVGR